MFLNLFSHCKPMGIKGSSSSHKEAGDWGWQFWSYDSPVLITVCITWILYSFDNRFYFEWAWSWFVFVCYILSFLWLIIYMVASISLQWFLYWNAIILIVSKNRDSFISWRCDRSYLGIELCVWFYVIQFLYFVWFSYSSDFTPAYLFNNVLIFL